MTLSVSQPPTEILPVLLDIQHALEACQRVDDAAYLRQKTKAIEAVTKEADASLEIKLEAIELRIRAERRLGQLLRDTPRNKGGSAEHDLYRTPEKPGITPATLEEQGVTKNMAESARALAKVDDAKFEEIIKEGKSEARVKQNKEPTRFLSTKGIIRKANPKDPSKELEFSPLIKPSDNWNFAAVHYDRIDESDESHGYIPGEIYANCFWYYAPDGGEVCDLMAGSGQAMRVYEDRERWGRGREIEFNLRMFDRLPRGRYKDQIEPLDATQGLPNGYHPDYVFMDVPYFGQVVGVYSGDDDDIANMDLAAWSEAMQGVANSVAAAQQPGGLVSVMAPNFCDWKHGRIMTCDLLRQWWVAAGYVLHDVAYSTRKIQQTQTPTMARTNIKAKRERLMLSDTAEIQTFRRRTDGSH
jgi:hypothetical protein